jgi:probable rRNA maturation factor
MKVSLDISVSSSLWRGLPRARAIARETIAAAALEGGAALRIDRPEGRASFKTPYGVEVSLCLADDAALRALNLRWRGIDKPTNVLSFPSSGGRLGDATMLGDIALAYETLAREGENLGVPLTDHYRHLIAHGFLHLIGYDHETDAEAERMEALETRILARLGAADPYAREFIGG